MNMQNLKIEDLAGVWCSEVYTLTVTLEKIAFLGPDIRYIVEPVDMKHLLNEDVPMTYNTMQLSGSINIYQIFDDQEVEIVIEGGKHFRLKRMGFENEFSLFRSITTPGTFVALRWYSPWGYIALFEIEHNSITKYLVGGNEEERIEINRFYNQEVVKESLWRRTTFKESIPEYRINELLEKMKEVLHEKFRD